MSTYTPPSPSEVQRAHARWLDDRRQALTDVRRAGSVVVFFGYLVGILGSLAAIGVGARTGHSYYGDTHPFVLPAIGIAAWSWLGAFMLLLFGYWARAWSTVNERLS